MSHPLLHTHAWLEFLDAANPKLRDAGPVHVLSISDTLGDSGQQSLSFTLPGRTKGGTPWRDLLTTGDLFRLCGMRTSPTGTAKGTLAEGMITDYQVSENMTAGQYSLTTHVSGACLTDVMHADAVAWWMFYGSEIGALRARGQLLPDDASGRLDRVLANYLNKVALNMANFERGGKGLADLLGYHLVSLKPNVPILYNLSIAEGSHWSIMSQHAELGLHDLYVQYLRPADGFKGGYVHHPGESLPTVISSDPQQKGDGARPYIVLKPKPYPYADANLRGVTKEWDALPVHDFTSSRATTGRHGFGRSMQGVRNFFMVFPGYESMNDRMAFTLGLAVSNPQSIRRFGYRPVKFGTNLILNEGSEADMIGLTRDLTARMAGQNNRLEEMSQGTITVPLAPEVQPGHRARFRLVHTDGTDAGVHEGYVASRTHQYQTGVGGTTDLSLTRVLPASVYRDPSWFTQGLMAVQVNWPEASHDHD